MSIGIYPVFKEPVTSQPFHSEGSMILEHLETLGDLATANGLKPLNEFSDDRPVPDDFDGDPDDLAELLGPFDEWFPVSEGLETVDGLVRTLATQPELGDDFELLLQELKDLAECLRTASPQDAEFRFEAG